MRVPVYVAAVVFAIAPVLSARQQPSVDELLRVTNEYITSYARKASGVSLQESYTLVNVSGGQMTVPLRLGSELVLVDVNGRLYSMRDTATVDGAKRRDPKVSRIMPLLVSPTQAGWKQAQLIADDSNQYFMSELIIRLNSPVLALHFVQPVNHAKFTYRVDGRKKINNVDTVGLRFEETRGELTKYMLGTRGNGYVRGRLWVDPATGAVHQTEMSLDSTTEGASVNVTYAPHKELNLLLPSKSGENYDTRPAPDNQINKGEGGYGGRFTYQANATYSNAAYTPVDLTKIR